MVTISAGETGATVPIPITDDDVVENLQHFRIELAWPGMAPDFADAAVTLDTTPAEVRIQDHDTVLLTLDRAVYEVDEGQTVDVLLNLSKAVECAFALTWSFRAAVAKMSNSSPTWAAASRSTMRRPRARGAGRGADPGEERWHLGRRHGSSDADRPQSVRLQPPDPSGRPPAGGHDSGRRCAALRTQRPRPDLQQPGDAIGDGECGSWPDGADGGGGGRGSPGSGALPDQRRRGPGQFTIDPESGALSFREAPDFELPADSDDDNEYVVEVTATAAPGRGRARQGRRSR